MHRSRLSVLVTFAAVAACSTRDDSEGTEILSQDRTLVARLEIDQETRQLLLPAACGTITVPAHPAVAAQHRAEELTRQAHVADMHGRVQEARSLLRRASELDGTNKSAAYHLGRTNEALGDRSAAKMAYCRYLALTPTTAESVEARQRVAKLSQSESRVAAGSISASAPTRRRAPATTARRATRAQPTVEPRVAAGATVERSAPATSRKRGTQSASAATGGADDSPTPSGPVTTTPEVDGRTTISASGGDVVATPREVPTIEQPSTASRTASRGPNRAQRAGIGAATGAIIGAATGRSVKSAVIGAAAGGILGSVVGGGFRPVGRGIVP